MFDSGVVRSWQLEKESTQGRSWTGNSSDSRLNVATQMSSSNSCLTAIHLKSCDISYGNRPVADWQQFRRATSTHISPFANTKIVGLIPVADTAATSRVLPSFQKRCSKTRTKRPHDGQAGCVLRAQKQAHLNFEPLEDRRLMAVDLSNPGDREVRWMQVSW